FFASVIAIGEPLGQALQLFAIERPGMHGQEGSAGGLGQLHEILPAVRIMFRIPEHAGDFFALDIAKETAHAQTFNEGRHIVFHARQVVWMWRHAVSSLYGLAPVTRHSNEQMPWFRPVRVSLVNLRAPCGEESLSHSRHTDPQSKARGFTGAIGSQPCVKLSVHKK